MTVPAASVRRPLGCNAVALAQLRGRRRRRRDRAATRARRRRVAGRRCASARVRCRRRRGRARRGWDETRQIARDLGARAPDGASPGGSSGEQAARQALRAEVDRAQPAGPVAPRADDDLRRAAADVDDGDRPLGRRRREPERADEREPSLLGRSSAPGPGSARPAPSASSSSSPFAAWRPGLVISTSSCSTPALRARLRRTPATHVGEPRASFGSEMRPCARRLRRAASSLALREDGSPAARDEQADGVRADVDDADGHASMVTTPHDGAPQCGRREAARAVAAAHEQRLRQRAGARSSSAATRSQVPSACSSQACELSASSALKIASSSLRTCASSTGTTTSIRWSRLRGIRSALPSRYVFSLAGLEAVEPAVLEEAAEHRADADVLAQARDAGDERADRAHDQVDLARPPARPGRAPRRSSGRVRLLTLIRMRACLPAAAAASRPRGCARQLAAAG